ncbi:AraC family transcriptional regulator [Paenibacillus tarimensis]
MTEIFAQKYSIDDEELFSIHYMDLKGYFKMDKNHLHAYYEIFYLLEGERVYFINDRVYTAKKGDMVVINPYDLHHTSSSDVPGCERIIIYFSPEFLPPFDDLISTVLPFAQGSRLLRFPMKDQPAVEQKIRDIYMECMETKTGYEACVRSTLTNLLVQIHRHLTDENLQPLEFAHPMHEKISEVASFLSQYYQDDISLEQIAKQFYISPSYLSRIFKKITGLHFREYLLHIRIREAQKRLCETQEKTLMIAEHVGFRHISHFNTSFKKIVGMSPLQYRKSRHPSYRGQAGTDGKADVT